MRTVKTFDAVQLLADAGYGPQALMLARTMIEDAVSAVWMEFEDRDSLSNLISTHEKSVSLHISKDRPGRESFAMLASVPTVADRILDLLGGEPDVTEGRATRHWTGMTVPGMARSAAPHLPEPERSTLLDLVALPYLLSNLVIHQSPASLGAAVVASADRRSMLSRSPSALFVHDALVISLRALALIAYRTTASVRRGELDDLVHEIGRFSYVITPSKAVGRNEPCPCGSGDKFKHCHLPLMPR